MIKTGDLVDVYDEGMLVCAVVTGEEKGRLKVVTERGKQLRVIPSRVAHRAGSAPASSDMQAAAAAAGHARAVSSRLSEVDLVALWDVLVDEPRRYTLGSLAALMLGGDDGVARSVLLRALQQDRIHFSRKQDDFEPRPRALVEESLRREAAEQARSERRAVFLEWARAALRAPMPPSAEAAPSRCEPHREHLTDLVELAIMGDEAESRREATSLLDEAGVPDGPSAERAFRLLRALGIFHPDENLFIHRFHLKTSFKPDVLESAARSAARPVTLEGRRDLRHIIAFTIDDDLTTELDDALSVESLDSRVVLGIHIADPGFFVQPGDQVDVEAMSRAATFYFPEVKLPMIPAAVAEEAASLVEGSDRPALSFLVTLSPLGELLSSEIVSSIIRSQARLSYDQADQLLRDPLQAVWTGAPELRDRIATALSRLRPICEALETERIAAGAVVIRAAEVDIRVRPTGEIVIRRIDERGVSRRLVSEAMILANRLAAEFCMSRGIPAIFRKQAAPQNTAAVTPAADASLEDVEAGGYDPVAVRALRRRMRRGETSLTPAPHHGLGLPAYIQATSPIRRYQDLVVHRQIKAALQSAPLPYDAEAMARIAATTDEAERAAREAERGTDEYWILRHYETRIGQELEGVIVAVDPRRTEVELTDTLHSVSIAARPDHRPGQRLRLVIGASKPRAGRMVLSEAGA